MVFIFALFIIAVQSLVALVHFIVYKTAAAFFPFSPRGLFYFRWSFVALSFTFVLASLLSFRWFNKFTIWFYRAAAVWLGTLHFLLLGCALIWLTDIFYSSRGLILPSFFAPLIFAAELLASASGLWRSFKTKIVAYDVALPNLPQIWRGKKIVLFADTHFGNVRGLPSAEKIARMIAKQNPDAILMAGDFYDGTEANIAGLANEFAGLRPPMGKYFTDGNHEEFRDNREYAKALRVAGFTVLNDEKVETEGLQIAGLVYKDSSQGELMAKKFKSMALEKNRPSIVIKHAPWALAASAEAGVSLQVSGHTHRGQVWPFNFLTKWIYKGYDYGAKKIGSMTQITTSGVGTWGPPQRLGSQSEIVVINLK